MSYPLVSMLHVMGDDEGDSGDPNMEAVDLHGDEVQWDPEKTKALALELENMILAPLHWPALPPYPAITPALDDIRRTIFRAATQAQCSSPLVLYAVAASNALSFLELVKLSRVTSSWRACRASRARYLETLRLFFAFDMQVYSERFAWYAMRRESVLSMAKGGEWYLPDAAFPYGEPPPQIVLPGFTEDASRLFGASSSSLYQRRPPPPPPGDAAPRSRVSLV